MYVGVYECGDQHVCKLNNDSVRAHSQSLAHAAKYLQ